jgi:hypothetical protein
MFTKEEVFMRAIRAQTGATQKHQGGKSAYVSALDKASLLFTRILTAACNVFNQNRPSTLISSAQSLSLASPFQPFFYILYAHIYPAWSRKDSKQCESKPCEQRATSLLVIISIIRIIRYAQICSIFYAKTILRQKLPHSSQIIEKSESNNSAHCLIYNN